MSSQEYYRRLEADRAVTRAGVVSWQAPRPERENGFTPKDLPSRGEFTLQPPNLSAVSHAADSTSYQRATNALERLARGFEQYRDAISPAADPANRKYSTEMLREHVEAIRSTAAYKDAVRQVEAVSAAAERAAQDVAYQRSALVQPLDAAGEQRNSRAWERAKTQLDAARGNHMPVVDEILSTAKPEQVGMLVEELPVWLKAHGVDPEFLDERFAALAPRYGDAKRLADVARQGKTVCDYNLKMIEGVIDRTEISSDKYRYHQIPLAGADDQSRAQYDSGL